MDDKVKSILEMVHETPDFAEVDFSDVNACSTNGDNALHCVVQWKDISAAKAMIDAGINVNKTGDLGYSPLHVACMHGDLEMIRLLIENGADLFAKSAGDTPFASARLSMHDNICDFLRPLMMQAQAQDPKIRTRSRIAQLKQEIEELEKEIKTQS